MPKSKRAKVGANQHVIDYGRPNKRRAKRMIPLSKVKKKTREWKDTIIQKARRLCDEYPDVYVFRYKDIRNEQFKRFREEMKGPSEFLMASTKKMQAALGRTPEEEHRPHIHRLTPHLRGHAGLLFTKLQPAEVEEALHTFSHAEFARAGAKATHTVQLPEGPLIYPGGKPFHHTSEHMLRKHGLPTKLKKGVVELIAPHTVCKEGARLTVHQAALLRHFGIQMATARLRLKAALRGDAADVVVFEVSDLEASDDDGDVEQFDDGLPSKMMLPEVLPQR